MPTIKKYIIKPDNVKTPFQMRATSPLNNWATIRFNKPALKDQVGTGVGVAAPIKDQTEFKHGAQVFIDENENKTNEFNTNLKDRIKGADNIAKKTRLEGKLGRKEKRQAARAHKIQRRNDKRNPQAELTERTAMRQEIKPGTFKTQNLEITKGTDYSSYNTLSISQQKYQDELTKKKDNEDRVVTSINGDEKVDISKQKPATLSTYQQMMGGGNPPPPRPNTSTKKVNVVSDEEKTKDVSNFNKFLNLDPTLDLRDVFKKGPKKPNALDEYKRFTEEAKEKGMSPRAYAEWKRNNSPNNFNSPLNYSVANPFNPSQQDLIGQVYNPSGNDINSFQQNQGANKVTYGQPNPAGNPNTYNQPAIPTEADTTMNDLQMGNAPMGDDLSGGMMPPTGLAPEQGMGSTQFGGVNTNPTIDLRRQQNRSTRQANRADKKAKRISDREYRSTGYRSGAMGGAILPQGN